MQRKTGVSENLTNNRVGKTIKFYFMFKKILPALTLMFVLTLSFAFRPAPQQQKAFDGPVYTWVNGAFVQGDATDLEPCTGGEDFCALEFPNGTDAGDAATAVGTFNSSNPNPASYIHTNPYTIGGIEGVKVYKREAE